MLRILQVSSMAKTGAQTDAHGATSPKGGGALHDAVQGADRGHHNPWQLPRGDPQRDIHHTSPRSLHPRLTIKYTCR